MIGLSPQIEICAGSRRTAVAGIRSVGLIIEQTQDPVPKFDETMFPCDRGVWRSVSISVFQSLSVDDRLMDAAPDPEHFGRRSAGVRPAAHADILPRGIGHLR
jgi:hypothetical protein